MVFCSIRKTLFLILCLLLLLSFGSAYATNIYVNSKDEILGTDITKAYAVGAGAAVEQ